MAITALFNPTSKYAPFLYPLLIITTMILGMGCFGSDEPTDEEMLQRDQEELEESLNSAILDYYKFFKISMRIMPVLDTTIEEHRKIKQLTDKIFPGMFDSDSAKALMADTTQKNITLTDVKDFISAYLALRKFARAHDEDEYPTLIEGQAIIDGDSVVVYMNGERKKFLPPLEGEAKEVENSLEHTIFSIFMIIDRGKNFTKSMLLYECSKSDMSKLEGDDLKLWLQMIRGFLFFDQGLLYLSEKEFNENLEWLYANPDEFLYVTTAALLWVPAFVGEEYTGNETFISNKAAHQTQLMINHTFRAITRMQMEREIDEQRALEDMEAIVRVANEAGLENEIVWSVEAYLYTTQEKSDSAIVALKKLRESELLNEDEQKTIDESIEYLEKREPGKVLNGVYDKYFLSKIITKYLYRKAKKQDWIKIMKELGIIKGDKLERITKNANNLMNKVEEETSTEALKEKGKELKDEGEKLLKDLWD